MSRDIANILKRFNQLAEGLDANQNKAKQLPALFKPRSISVLNNPTDPAHPMDGYAVGASESVEPVAEADANDPFEQGWRTFFRRGDESDNPYEKGTPEYQQWLNGFQEGEAQPNHYDESAVEPRGILEGIAAAEKTTEGVFDIFKKKPAAQPATQDVKADQDARLNALRNKPLGGSWKVGDVIQINLRGAQNTSDAQFARNPQLRGQNNTVGKIVKITPWPQGNTELATVQVTNGTQSYNIQWPVNSQHISKYVAPAKPVREAERNEMDTPAVQAALKKMAERHKDEKWTKEQLEALGKRLAAAAHRKSVKEDVATEDVISQLKDKLGDYLADISKEIKKDPDLVDKLAAKPAGDEIGPPVKKITTDDGHEISIHGNEDDGFRVSIKNKPAKAKFESLDHAVMACEMYCARRRGAVADRSSNNDYLDEA